MGTRGRELLQRYARPYRATRPSNHPDYGRPKPRRPTSRLLYRTPGSCQAHGQSTSNSQYGDLLGKMLTRRPVFGNGLPQVTRIRHFLGMASGKVDDNVPY